MRHGKRNCIKIHKKKKKKRENAAFHAAAVRKFTFWVFQFWYYVLSIYSNSHVHHTEISRVGTSHILKLWMLARSTTEFKSCRNHCTQQLSHTKAELRFRQHSNTICTAPPAREEQSQHPQSLEKLPALLRKILFRG